MSDTIYYKVTLVTRENTEDKIIEYPLIDLNMTRIPPEKEYMAIIHDDHNIFLQVEDVFSVYAKDTFLLQYTKLYVKIIQVSPVLVQKVSDPQQLSLFDL